jgi:hypothetical protein
MGKIWVIGIQIRGMLKHCYNYMHNISVVGLYREEKRSSAEKSLDVN